MRLGGISGLFRNVGVAVAGGDPETGELIATGLWLFHVLQVYTSCMMAVAVWDWLCCIKMEWHRIWKREWSIVNFLYLWTRYYGLVCFSINLWLFNGSFTTERCKVLHFLIVPTCMWVSVSCELILTVRTYAFLGRKLWVALFLGTLLLGEIAFLLFVAVRGVHQNPLPLGNVGPCTASDRPGQHIVMGCWLAPVVFDLICTGMTFFKAFQLKRMGVKSPVIAIFVREGLFYFVAVVAVNVINAVFMFQTNANIQNINSYLALVLSQVLCCRLVLNLRSRGSDEHTSSTQSQGHSFNGPSLASRRAPHAFTSNFNIPLDTFQGAATSRDYNYADYPGIKVDVEQIRTEK